MCAGEEMKGAIFFFSAKSTFFRHPNNSRIFIWRVRDTRNNPTFAHESVRFASSGVMVYASTFIDGRTDLHIIQNGALTGRRYRNEILKPIIVSYVETI